MAEEFKPNETTTLEAEVAGNKFKASTRRVSELTAIISLVVLAGQIGMMFHLYQQSVSLQLSTRADMAALKAEIAESAAAQRELNCVVLSSDEERRVGAPGCKAAARR